MSLLAYHASHEQHKPSALLKYAVMAEEAGFTAIHSSDHFYPWSETQGESGFSFSWLGAAMQATSLPFSVVCAPGYRYHPAVVAQAAATLSEMFPGRFALELGSGEALNEHIAGKWPEKPERNERLKEAAGLIQRLLSGEAVTGGNHFPARQLKLYTLPNAVPEILIAAITEATAEWAGTWAPGLITTAASPEETHKKMEAFLQKNPNRPMHIQFSFSFAATEKEAVEVAYRQWRNNLLPPGQLADIETPGAFDEAGKRISMEDFKGKFPVFTDIKHLAEAIQAYKHPGVSRIILHNVHPDQDGFLKAFGQYRF